MRKIKFRGFGKDDKATHWIYGNLLDEPLIGLVAIQDENCHVWKVDPESVGQFTGLCDADGREIYEGDVVTCGDDPIPSEVRWSPALSGFVIVKSLLLGHALKFVHVIGNVHDNPELLTKD